MNRPQIIMHWIKTQFRTQPVRSALVSFFALLVTAGGIMWVGGVFASKEQDENFTYLPDRAYILAEQEPSEPETLEELLHTGEPDVDTMLRKPAIAQELIQAQVLTDVVDSRLALNNLRSLDQQLTDRLAEVPESIEVLDLAELRSHAGIALSGYIPRQKNPAMLSSLPILQTQNSPEASAAYNPAMIQVRAQAQTDELTAFKSATSRLLKAPATDKLVAIPASINIKTVWQKPGEGLVHLLPSGEWVPEQGYQLYRIVNGESILIAEQLASTGSGINDNLMIAGTASIKDLYEQATLTPEKLTKLGMSAAEFDAFAYRTDSLKAKSRVGGEIGRAHV